jgi:DNA-binding CsgD family transcriptional regulator
MPEAIYSPTLHRVSVSLEDEVLIKRNIDGLHWHEKINDWLERRGFRRTISSMWSSVGEGFRCEVISCTALIDAGLTERQCQAVRLFALGKQPREVGNILGIKKTGVDGLRTRIAERLGTRNIADWTRYALREGIITPDDMRK